MKKTIISAIALAAVSVAGAQTVKNLVVTDLDGKTTQFQADQIEAVVFQFLQIFPQCLSRHRHRIQVQMFLYFFHNGGNPSGIVEAFCRPFARRTDV